MPNTKILVHFQNKKVIHTEHHAGSTEYKYLISLGYEQVGTVKPLVNKGIPEVTCYWDPEYFKPNDKYLNNLKPSE